MGERSNQIYKDFMRAARMDGHNTPYRAICYGLTLACDRLEMLEDDSAKLRADLETARAEYKKVVEWYTADHTEVGRLKAELAQVRAAFAEANERRMNEPATIPFR